MTRPEPARAQVGEQLIESARDLAPTLLERASQTDRDRRVPDETYQQFVELGLLKVLKPARYGGHQLGLYEHGMIALELARGCGSSGWIYSLLDEGNWFISLLPQEAQDEVWGADSDATAAGSLRPIADLSRVEVADGGFRVSGRFGFASGSDHATWIFVAAFVPPIGDEAPAPYFFLIPKSELKVVDDWFVLGMRGTGSRTYVADDVFVPAHRAAAGADFLSANMAGAEVHPEWKLLRAPRRKVNPFIASAPTVGVALGAVDTFRKAVGGARGKAAGSQYLQLRFAESAAEADAARLLVETALRETMALVDSGEPIPEALTARLLRDAAFVGLLSHRCVDRLHAAMGSTVIFENHALERALRDVHTGIAQAGVQWEPCAQPYALLALDLSLTWNPSGLASGSVK